VKERFSRQGFLGEDAQRIFDETRVGILGLGGGGSHVVQQLAYIGFKYFVIFDPDVVKDVNLNRLVGATEVDARWEVAKVAVADRMVHAIRADAVVDGHKHRWQEIPLRLRGCDLVFGCLDGFAERREAEACCRRFLIPYIDIGLDVHEAEGEPPQMAGQIILSIPGEPCMTCLGFLTEKKLAREAAAYGAAGPRPQVVWANGVLASTAVGVAVELLTDWTRGCRAVYLSYDSNTGVILPHPRLQYAKADGCPHYPLNEVGEPILKTA
jgi:hypothetical protein